MSLADIHLGCARLRREADWRAFMAGDAPWTVYDAVIFGGTAGPGGTRPSRQTYEVYLYGRLIALRPSLTEAKDAIEATTGPLEWQSAKTEPVEVNHYFFGPTTEFTAPNTYWYVAEVPA